MPQVTVYIKEEDMAAWKALPNKAEAIRSLLNSGTAQDLVNTVANMNADSIRLNVSGVDTPAERSTWISAGERYKDAKAVQAGYAGDAIAALGMSPACCLNKKPCKHWSWDGLEQSYVNSITGEIKPVGV